MSPALPWFPKKVLVSDPLHEGLGHVLGESRPDLEIRERGVPDVTEADVAWAEVFVGFRPPKQGSWRALPWYAHYSREKATQEAYLFSWAPHAYALLFPKQAAP